MIINYKLSQIAVMISAAVVKKSEFEFASKYESTWASTIAFSVIGIVVSLSIFILNIFKIPKKYDFEHTMNNLVNYFYIFIRNINFFHHNLIYSS